MAETPKLDRYVDYGIRTAKKLCSQPTIAAQGRGLEETAALVQSLLADVGFSTRLLRPDDGPPVVYGELRGTGPFTLLLYNHYDVQPAEPLELWTSPPFEPTERDGKLYARGISDNKGEIATRLAAIRALIAETGASPISIRWILEGEEEVGSPHFGDVAERYADLLQADGALWEGSGATPSGRPDLTLGAKGLLYVELRVRCLARDAHSGYAPILPSAAWRMVQALATLRGPDGRVRIPGFYDAVRPPSAAQREALETMPDTSDSLREMYEIDSFVDDLTGVELRERAAFGPTCNIAGLWTGYTGEGVKTVLADSATAKLDFRLVPDQDPHEVLEQLRAHLDANGYTDIEIVTLGAAAPVVTPISTPFVQQIVQIVEDFYGETPSLTPSSGGSLPLLEDLQRHVGVPGLFAPGNPGYWGSREHAPNEHIRLQDFERSVYFLYELFQRLGQS